MEGAWDLEPGGAPGVVVAVVDTGVAYENHVDYAPIGASGKLRVVATFAQAPDLEYTSFVSGYDFVNNDEHANDDEGHGTHVTGTIAQSTDNSIGVAGIAYNTSIMPVKVLDQSGSGTYFNIAEGIYFAAEQGARVINLSLGGSSPSDTLEQSLATAHNSGVTIVCASGNNGSPVTVSYPAAYDDYCIAVGATRYDEEIAPYSNRGAALDLTAPGGDMTVDQNGDGYGDGVLQQSHDGIDYTNFGYWVYQGTSMAAPHVTGVAALLISHGVAEDPDSVREALQATAEDHGAAGWDPDYGWGIVDAAAALAYAPGGNGQPVADAGGTYSGPEDQVVTFDGSGSFDDDNDPLTYNWDFGDESLGSGGMVSHAYSASGSYTVTLIVSDGELSGQDTAGIQVMDISEQVMHVTTIDMTLKSAGINTSSLAVITIVDSDGFPLQGVTVSGQWSDATSDSDSGVTDINGQVSLLSNNVKRASSGTTFTLTVTGVELAGWIYDDELNEESSNSISVP